jgi:hypothetical protein
VPPGITPATITWSFWKSVGLSTTVMPLDSRHSVAPSSAMRRSLSILPGFGARSIRSPPPASST